MQCSGAKYEDKGVKYDRYHETLTYVWYDGKFSYNFIFTLFIPRIFTKWFIHNTNECIFYT
jgi:hypothetical protein